VRTLSARARPRIALLAAALAAAAVLLAGCGSSEETASVGGGTMTVPSDVHDFYGELKALLDQLPYQGWYSRCLVSQVESLITPKEAEGLADLPEAKREAKTAQVIGKAGPACEKTGRPIIDPNAPAKALELLRTASVVPEMVELAEANGFGANATACIRRTFEALPDKFLIELRNGTDKARAAILRGAFEPCAKAK
jgi:hypothetical protein